MLRGRRGMPIRHAVEYGKRVEYFRGDKLASFILENKRIKKAFPQISCKEDVMSIGRALVQNGYIHRSDRDGQNRRVLQPSSNHDFVSEGYYTWMYDGPKTIRNIMTFLLIVTFLTCTCFPIWPDWAKVAIWYLSVTFLIFVFVFCVIRLFIFFILWMIGYDFWIYPNIFDDDLGVVDSFKPLYSFRSTEKAERIYRIVGTVAFIVFCVWIKNQPTEFDEYIALTKQFTDDIYSGKLISDMTQQQKEGIETVRIPDLEELMRDDEVAPEHDEEDENEKFSRIVADIEDEEAENAANEDL